MFYAGVKNQVRSIINKHFPPEISDRFTLRSDAEIWIPKEDETVWNKWRRGTESVHILFDGMELLEIPNRLDPKYAELFFLKSFKQAIKNGEISFSKKLEWTDNATAKRNKREQIKKRRLKLEDSFKFALHNPDSVETTIKKFGDKKRKVLRSRGGE